MGASRARQRGPLDWRTNLRPLSRSSQHLSSAWERGQPSTSDVVAVQEEGQHRRAAWRVVQISNSDTGSPLAGRLRREAAQPDTLNTTHPPINHSTWPTASSSTTSSPSRPSTGTARSSTEVRTMSPGVAPAEGVAQTPSSSLASPSDPSEHFWVLTLLLGVCLSARSSVTLPSNSIPDRGHLASHGHVANARHQQRHLPPRAPGPNHHLPCLVAARFGTGGHGGR